jgi:uncharacterized protein YdeI (YjbR/CyaY-like superfamily)
MKPATHDRVTLVPETRAAWRRWLTRNHATSPGVWLVYYKKHAATAERLTYESALLDALCFGWIDSRIHPLDKDRCRQMFSPRRPKSVWSAPNKARVVQLIAQGLMRPAGQAAIDAAKTNGAWDQLDAAESLVIPVGLRRELRRNASARRNFEALSAWAQKRLLWWIHSAKRPETRQRRIGQLVERVSATAATGAEAVYAIIVSAGMRQAAGVPRRQKPEGQATPGRAAITRDLRSEAGR